MKNKSGLMMRTKIVIAALVFVLLGSSLNKISVQVTPIHFEDIIRFLDVLSDEDKENNINDPATLWKYAEVFGFEEIYYVNEYLDNVEVEVPEIVAVYGRGVRKGNPETYEVIPVSDHACYLGYYADNSSGAELVFKNKGDCMRFWVEALDYGLLMKDGGKDGYLVPNQKLPSGSREMVDEDWDRYGILYWLTKRYEPQYGGMWIIDISIDF